MGARPRMPAEPKMPSASPNMLDPTVMFARIRERQKAMAAQGRQATILSRPLGGTMPQLGTTKVP